MAKLPQNRRCPSNQRPPLRLTQRDVLIFAALLRYRLLTLEQICILLFITPNSEITVSRLNVARRRMKLLYHHGYVQRRVPSMNGDTDGRHSYVYYLDVAGIEHLCGISGQSAEELGWTDKDPTKGIHFRHRILVAETQLLTELGAKELGIQVTDFMHEDALFRAHREDALNVVVPDIYLHLTLPNKRDYWFFFEIDRSTETLLEVLDIKGQDIATKIKKYLEYIASDFYDQRYQTADFPRILFLTTTKRRASNILDCINQVIGIHQSLGSAFWVSSLDVFEELSIKKHPAYIFTKKIWRQAGSDFETYVRILRDDDLE